MDLHAETAYIIGRAQAHDARCVSLGVLVFFSTQVGDAWMLDIEDDYAMCLARDGAAQPLRILETAHQFAIDWDGKFHIEEDVFTTIDKSGRITTFMDYPLAGILDAIERARRLSAK